jgi:hypothetical protein
MHACMIHTYIHTYTHIHTYTYIHTYIHTYIRTYIHTYIHTYTHTYTHTYIHTYIHIYIHTYTYIHTYIHIYLLIEVNSQTRIQLLQNKLKLEWVICNIDDYMSVNRCMRCSHFNHRHTECKSKEACPLCAGKHKLKECTASRPEYKCINCMTYNTYNQNKKTNENHSSLDRNCPSLQAMIVKYRQNTN